MGSRKVWPDYGTQEHTRRMAVYAFVKERDGLICHYCGIITVPRSDTNISQRKVGVSRTIDHVVPLDFGGQDDATNMVISCERCNGRKSNTIWPTHCLYCAIAYDTYREAILANSTPEHTLRYWLGQRRVYYSTDESEQGALFAISIGRHHG